MAGHEATEKEFGAPLADDGHAAVTPVPARPLWKRRGIHLAAVLVLLYLNYLTISMRFRDAPITDERNAQDLVRPFPADRSERGGDFDAIFRAKPAAFDWNKIPSLPDLHYVRCYDDHFCARLELPMDYWNGTTDKNISLAVIKLPATVKVDDPLYRGPVLFNPGGPGGSGVEMIAQAGLILETLVQGTFPKLDGPRYYDAIGFDPRGIGQTLPRISCTGGVAENEVQRIRIMEEGSLNSSDAALGRLWSLSSAYGERCSRVKDDSLQHFMSTAYVARDMLEIVEASARWRQKELQAMGSKMIIKPKEEKIQYWGFSYGTALGLNFASMFPERVGRLLLDGVMGMDSWISDEWEEGLADTEKVIDAFYYHCARVGYPKCPLAEQVDPTPEQVGKRTKAIIANLWHNPIPVIEPYIDMVSWSDVRLVILTSIYQPVASFPFMATMLAELERGETTTIAKVLRPYHSFTCGKVIDGGIDPFLHPIKPNAKPAPQVTDPFAAHAIACSDADDMTTRTKADFKRTVDNAMGLSPMLGDLWIAGDLPCYSYRVRPQYRYTGPWRGDTANPIMFIGNTADPVTPVRNCYNQAPGFKGAGVLRHNAAGHCSLAAYSRCTSQRVAAYFANGTVPEDGAVCEVDILPWDDGLHMQSAEDTLARKLYGDLSQTLFGAGAPKAFKQAASRIDVKGISLFGCEEVAPEPESVVELETKQENGGEPGERQKHEPKRVQGIGMLTALRVDGFE